jgi:hypothetical protein
VVVVCVVLPSGVDTLFFVVEDVLSAQPTAPTSITPIIKTALIMRFISRLLGLGPNSGSQIGEPPHKFSFDDFEL